MLNLAKKTSRRHELLNEHQQETSAEASNIFFSQKSTTKSSQARNFLNGPRSSRRCNLDYYRTLIGSRTLEAELTVRQHSRTVRPPRVDGTGGTYRFAAVGAIHFG